jgi:molecular chaperone GrpE
VRQQLVGVLAQHNCVEIPAEGAEFDPQFHAAILQQPSADVPAGHVTMVTQAGYRLHDRVVRPAQVIVSSGAAAAGS